MNGNVVKLAKGLIGLVSLGITIATSFLDKKELDAKIAKKVAEEVTEQLAKKGV